MEFGNYLSDSNVLYMVTGFVLGLILYLWLSIVKSRMLDMTSFKTYISADDLQADLRRMDRNIPCAILRGYIRQRNLKILDGIYEGVLRQTQTEEVYEKNILPDVDGPEDEEIDVSSPIMKCYGWCKGSSSRNKNNNMEPDKITTEDELESVQFGLIEPMGNKWLIEELGPPEDYAHLMKKSSSQVIYLNCNNVIGGTYAIPIIRPRTLIKVIHKSRMLMIGSPVTIMGKITVSDFGNIRFGRPDDSVCNYIISSKSPEAMARQDSITVLYILGGMFFSAFIMLYGAFKLLQGCIYIA